MVPPSEATGRRAIEERLVGLLPILRAVAQGLSRDAEEIEALVAEAHAAARAAIEGGRAQAGNPRGWLVGILHDVHLERCRQRAGAGEEAAATAGGAPAWAACTAEDVTRATARLDEELRAVYTRVALEGQTYEEAAEALGVPKASVEARVARARARLKELLAAELAR